MNSQNKLLKRCEDNFNEETQEFVMQQWWPHFEDEGNNDFVNRFIYEFVHDTVSNSKYGTILKIYMMDIFDEYLAGFKQDLFN